LPNGLNWLNDPMSWQKLMPPSRSSKSSSGTAVPSVRGVLWTSALATCCERIRSMASGVGTFTWST
jgi:hypothetical protein